MKKFVFILSVFFSVSLTAQFDYEWSEPVIITDTNSFYANPYVAVYQDTSWMFYEKQEQRSSIYMMNLNDLENNFLLLGSETVNYKYPVFYISSYPEFMGRLFYLSDEEGVFNLYAARLFENDSLGTPLKVIHNPANNDIADYFLNFNGLISYTIDSMVYAAEIKMTQDTVYTEKNTLLDSSSFNIKVNYDMASWQKIENDSSHIKSSRHYYDIDSTAFFWEAPKYLDSTGNCRWLISNTLSDFTGTNYFFWVKNNKVKGIFGYFPYTDTVTLNTYSKPDVRQITFLSWWYGVKKTFYDPYYLCFTTGTGDSSEIYSTSTNFWNDEGVYLSSNDYPDDHPEVFFGELKSLDPGGGWTLWVYCIWQVHINGKTALAMSKNIATFTTSIQENHDVDQFLKLAPNPFHDKLKISVNTNGRKSGIVIISTGGKQVADFTPSASSNEWQTFYWQPSSKIAGGVYFIVLTTGDAKYVKKVVLSH